MSSCVAVVLDCKTQVAFFPFHGVRTEEEAEVKAFAYIDEVISAVGQEESHRFHLAIVRPKVLFRLHNGVVVECDLDDVDLPSHNGERLHCFGYNHELRHGGHWDLDGAEVIGYIA